MCGAIQVNFTMFSRLIVFSVVCAVTIISSTIASKPTSRLDQLLLETQCRLLCVREFPLHNCTEEFAQLISENSVCEDLCGSSDACINICSCIISSWSDGPHKTLNNESTSAPSLHCRDEHHLMFRWPTVEDANIAYGVEFYVLQLRENDIEDTYDVVSLEPSYSFDELTPQKEYALTVWRFSKDKWHGASSGWVATWSEDFTPHPVSRILMTDVQLDSDSEHFYTTVNWTPADDMSCSYELLWWAQQDAYSQQEIREPNQECSYTVKGLEFASNYSLAISAISSDGNRESNKTWITILTPTCLRFFGNLSICAPDRPEDMVVTEQQISDNSYKLGPVYDILVRWARPELLPIYYEVQIISYSPIPSSKYQSYNYNISGNESSHLFQGVHLGTQYQVSLRAVSGGGTSEALVETREIEMDSIRILPKSVPAATEPYTWEWFDRLLIILAVAIPVLLLGLVLFIVLHKRAKNQRHEARCRYFEELEQKAPKDGITSENINSSSDEMYDEYSFEICRKDLTLHTILGEGAFGVVRRGWILPQKQEVAVKMLRDSASSDDVHQLRQEIEMMKSVGTHPHIVSMIGCCTRGKMVHEVLLVVEYCALGDLLNFLRQSWNHIHENSPNWMRQYQGSSNSEGESETRCNVTVNRTYGFEENENVLMPIDLLSFARQITMGMEFLATNRVVHRDLAARNVLITENRTLKIADFGLSRDIYRDNMYRKTGNGKLPIKWMAVESLTHQIYTTQSDVWSFGIVLWEIVTLGGNPYPSTPTNRLLQLLKSGYRMECPVNCSTEIYALMQACWRIKPKDRPTFQELRKSFEALLENNTPAEYLYLNSVTNNDCAHSHYNDMTQPLNKQPDTSGRYVEPVNACSNNSYDLTLDFMKVPNCTSSKYNNDLI